MFEPRAQHYFFAHDYMKEIYFNNSDDIRSEKVNYIYGNQNDFIAKLWKVYYKNAIFNEVYIPEGNLNIEYIHFDKDTEICLITLPKAEAMTEAHYVGMVFSDNEIDPQIYFTLEKSLQSKSIICYWDKNNSHNNTGIAIDVEKSAFLEAIKELYERMRK